MKTIRKQYSSNYQVLELTEEYETNEERDLIGTQMDEFAKEELERMVNLVSNIAKPDTIAKPTTNAEAGSKKASDTQLNHIKKNLAKCKLIAEDLGITLDSKTLTMTEAKQILERLWKRNDSGF